MASGTLFQANPCRARIAWRLAIGIGASTAMFSVVDAVFLRPLPYRLALAAAVVVAFAIAVVILVTRSHKTRYIHAHALPGMRDQSP